MTYLRSWCILFLWGMLFTSTLSAQVNASDSLELVRFYSVTAGASWTQSWDLNQPVPSWRGVSVDPTLGRVTALQLNDNNLNGMLPELDLPQLTRLDLRNNSLSGPIPTFVDLPQLQILELERNQLTGSLPSFSANGNLRILNLNRNRIQGTLAPTLALPWLTELKLLGNQLNGAVPDFTNLSALTFLDLSYNNLSGIIPDFSNLPNLSTLYLSGNQLVTPIPDFSALPALEQLALADNPFNSTFPTFSNLSNLRELVLAECGLQGAMPTLSNFPNLEAVLVGDNELTGEIPPLWAMPTMYRTDFERNQFTSIAPISSFSPRLRFVYFYENQLTFENLLPVHATIDSLTRLNNGFYTYNFQDNIGTADTLYVAPGGSFTIDLGVDDTVTTNIYDWYLRGIQHTVLIGNNRLTVTNMDATKAGVYYCQVSNPYIFQRSGVSPMLLISRPVRVFLTNSTEVLPQQTFELFPNPTHTVLSLKNVPFVGAYTFRLLDLTGNVILERSYHSPQVHLSVADIPAGHYVVQLIQGDAFLQQRFIKR